MRKNIWSNFVKGEKFELSHYVTYLFQKHDEKEKSRLKRRESIITFQSLSREY